jgi:hypothetical protein
MVPRIEPECQARAERLLHPRRLQAGCTVPILRFASWQQGAQLDRFVAGVAPRLRDAAVAAGAA